MTAMIFNIQRYSLHDGPGIRTTVFFKGCNMRCLWCHNPESQNFGEELMFDREKCVKCGKCVEYCKKAFTPDCEKCGRCYAVCRVGARKKCGDKYTVSEVFEKISADRDYYDVSGGGVTLSGGEPLLQSDFALEVLKKCRNAKIHTAVETAGNVPYGVIEKILPFTDLFLFDIKCIDGEFHKKLTGSSNSIILENAERLKREPCELLFRMPVVPGFNDGEAAAVAEFAGDTKIELMPYHNFCSSKYESLGREFLTKDVQIPTEEYIKTLANRFDNVIN